MRTPVGHDVVGHPRELVDPEDLDRPVGAQPQPGRLEVVDGAGPGAGPHDVGQDAEDAVEVERRAAGPAGGRAGAGAGRRRARRAGGSARSISTCTTSVRTRRVGVVAGQGARGPAGPPRRSASAPSAGAGNHVSSTVPSLGTAGHDGRQAPAVCPLLAHAREYDGTCRPTGRCGRRCARGAGRRGRSAARTPRSCGRRSRGARSGRRRGRPACRGRRTARRPRGRGRPRSARTPRPRRRTASSATAPLKSRSRSSGDLKGRGELHLALDEAAEPVELDRGQVAHQPEQRHRRRRDGALRQLLGVEALALHLEGHPEVVEVLGQHRLLARAACCRCRGGRPRGRPTCRGTCGRCSLMGRHSAGSGVGPLKSRSGGSRDVPSAASAFAARAAASAAGPAALAQVPDPARPAPTRR